MATCVGATAWYSLWFPRVRLLPSTGTGLAELTFVKLESPHVPPNWLVHPGGRVSSVPCPLWHEHTARCPPTEGTLG